MDKILNLSKIWEENARNQWQTDFDDLNREMSGAQGNRINRFISSENDLTGHTDNKKDNDAEIMLSWLEHTTASYQKSYHQFMGVADDSIKFYDQFDHELEQMKAELEDFKEAHDQKTIHLSDGRQVHIDESGNYVYQDQFGGWNDLEDSAIEEAKAKHQILGDKAITKAQKVRLDEYEAKLEYADAMKDQNRQQAIELKEAAENGDLSQDELEEGKEQIEKDKQEFEEFKEGLKVQKDEISQDVKADIETQETTLGNDLSNQMFGKNFDEQSDTQPNSKPPTIG